MAYKKERKEIAYKVHNHCGVLKHGTKGWSRQVNLVQWTDTPVLLDVRDWNYDQTKYTKGITMTRDEAVRLRDILISMNLGDAEQLPYPDAPEESLDIADGGFGFGG